MALSIGIVGLPNVGKSTLFNALTRKSVPTENFPFCTIDPSVGVVAVPDERLKKLGALSQSEKVIPAAVEFVDIAGLVGGASAGEGLGNRFLSHIREVQVIAEVVRLFEDPSITHVHGKVNPMDDIEVINLELLLADQETIGRRLGGIEKEVKRGDKEAILEEGVLQKLLQELERGYFVRNIVLRGFSKDERAVIKQLHLLTTKPFLYVLNRKSEGINLEDERYAKLLDFLRGGKHAWIEVDAGVEAELSEVSESDKKEFRREYGVFDNGIDALIQKSYQLLDLITFFTTGPKETRAWTIKRGSTAPQAGAAIHSDFLNKFIRAEVISYEELVRADSIRTGSTQGSAHTLARERGLVRTEGKDYVVQDGDVIEFKI